MIKYGDFLVRIFQYSNWIQRFAELISTFSPNSEKFGPEKNFVFGHYPCRVYFNISGFFALLLKSMEHFNSFLNVRFDFKFLQDSAEIIAECLKQLKLRKNTSTTRFQLCLSFNDWVNDWVSMITKQWFLMAELQQSFQLQVCLSMCDLLVDTRH